MAQSSVIIPKMTPSRVIEGTPDEIATYLKTLDKDEDIKLTLIIPGEELTAETIPHAGMTFTEILAPLQQDFEATGMTDEELGEFIDAEIKAHRAERRAREQQLNG
jgi:hypothetical protein